MTAKIEYWKSKYYTSTKQTKPPSAQCHTGDSLAAGTPVPSDLLELGPASDVASAQGTVCMLGEAVEREFGRADAYLSSDEGAKKLSWFTCE